MDIEIIHTAHNRIGFAGGAVLAAEFAIHKKGIFGMKEVLGLQIKNCSLFSAILCSQKHNMH